MRAELANWAIAAEILDEQKNEQADFEQWLLGISYEERKATQCELPPNDLSVAYAIAEAYGENWRSQLGVTW